MEYWPPGSRSSRGFGHVKVSSAFPPFPVRTALASALRYVQATPVPSTALVSQIRTTCAGDGESSVQSSFTAWPPAQLGIRGCIAKPQSRRGPSWLRAHGDVTIPPAGGSVTGSAAKLLASQRGLNSQAKRSTGWPSAVVNGEGTYVGFPASSRIDRPSQRNWSGLAVKASGCVTGPAASVTSTHWHSRPAV